MMHSFLYGLLCFLNIFLSFRVEAYEERYVPVSAVKELSTSEIEEADSSRLGNAKLEEYVLDGRYRAGRNLVYDCDRNHYACVDDISKDNCNFRRSKQEMHKRDNLSCAFFKVYLSKKECLIEHYKMMEKKPKPIFCFKKSQ